MGDSRDRVVVGDVPLRSDGRVTIPSRIRDAVGVVERQLVTVIVTEIDKRFSAPIDAKGRVSIPDHIRGEIEGETVDIELVV